MGGYLPSLPALADEFGATASLAQASVAVFLVGLGAGQLVIGPLSDVFGRRRPMLAAIVAYVAASLGCALAPTIELFIVFRLLQGVSASAGIVISRAIVRDLYRDREAARFLSQMVMIYGLAPLLAPLLGGAALTFTDWRGLFFGFAGLGLLMLVVAALALPETQPPERRRASGALQTLAAFRGLLGDREFLGYAVALGSGAGCVAAIISASSFVLQDIYDASPQVYGAFFSCGAALMILASQLNATLLDRFRPEALLRAGGVGLVAIAATLLVAVEADAGVWVVAPCMLGVMGCWGAVPSNAISLAMSGHSRSAGSASAVLGIFQFGTAGLIAPIVGVGGVGTALPMAVATFALSVVSAGAVRLLTEPVAIGPPG